METTTTAKKAWSFSHGYNGWEFYTRPNGERVAINRNK